MTLREIDRRIADHIAAGILGGCRMCGDAIADLITALPEVDWRGLVAECIEARRQ